ncbi:esterase/lipase family protein [Pimelobacter simplex]|uniref:esterase/lipase family protein n=1 Tax=Nocardioides simplex TaxID=2045 RepID=UPI003AAC2EAD
MRRLALAAFGGLISLILIAPSTPPAAADVAAGNLFPRALRYGQLGDDNSIPAAFATSILQPNRNPLGANDWSCRPSAKHPRPVVLVQGTLANPYANWNGLSPMIKHEGYCVFALNYGNTTGIPFVNATGDLIDNAREVAAYVDRVLAATGATQVDLIGHSQGGALARYYTNVLGGAPKVNQVIALAPSNHPTTLAGITELGKMFRLFGLAMGLFDILQLPALKQQADQSPNPQAPFYQQLNDNGETVAGERYTNIVTRNDEVVTPYRAGFITAGPGATVDNIVLQDKCGLDQSEHLSIVYSKNVAQIVLNKLDPSDTYPLFCYAQAPVFGNTQLFG